LKNKIYQKVPNPEYLSFIVSDKDFTQEGNGTNKKVYNATYLRDTYHHLRE
jgi:hypothetical protein